MSNSASTMRHDETVLTVAGAPVRCYRAGPAAGPVLVLVHGRHPDSARAAWAAVWPALTPHARLVAPDLPGCGGSPLGATAPTVDGYRAGLLRFLDACGIGRATVAGRSLGAGVALRTALDTPARVAGLMLLRPEGVPGGASGELAGVTCPVLLVTDGGPERVAAELIACLALARDAAGDQ